MAAYLLACVDGEVTIAAGGYPLCSGAWALSPAAQPFVVDQAAIVALGAAFAAGFGLVTSLYLVSVGIRAVLSFFK